MSQSEFKTLIKQINLLCDNVLQVLLYSSNCYPVKYYLFLWLEHAVKNLLGTSTWQNYMQLS